MFVVVAVAGAVVGLSACGGSGATTGPPPGAVSTTTVDPTSAGPPTSPSSTPRPTATVDPYSDAAIIAAAHDYVAAIQRSGETASTAPFFAISTSRCNCREGVISVVTYLTERHLTQDAQYRFAADPRIVARNGSNADLLIAYRAAPYHYLDRSGRIVGQHGSDSGTFKVGFVLQEGQWLADLISAP